MKPLVYVAGPVTGNPWGCVRQATDVFPTLREIGVVPFLPQLSVLHEIVDPQDYETWLSYDFDVIRHCDALLRLPGESKGADREVEFAHSLGIPVFAQIVGRHSVAKWVETWRVIHGTKERCRPLTPLSSGSEHSTHDFSCPCACCNGFCAHPSSRSEPGR